MQNPIPSAIALKLFEAMKHFRQLAELLIGKLLLETEQPEIDKICTGEYCYIQNTPVEILSEYWCYDVHGEHVMFKNTITGQTLEVFLLDKDSLGDLDSYFFLQFIHTTPEFKPLAVYFPNGYQDMVTFMKEMVDEQKMVCLTPYRFRVKNSPSEIQIRKYNNSDYEAVLALLRLNIPQYFAPEEEQDLEHYLQNEAEHYYVMEQNGEIVGCGGFNFSEDGTTGKISWDFFHPAQQGKGLGTKLTRFRIEKLSKFPQVKTISVRTSQLAYPFYEKLGFVTQETVKDYWAKGYDMVRMELGIDAETMRH